MKSVEKLLCDACKSGKFERKEFEAFTEILGVSGKCVYNPKNVLETYVKQQGNTIREETCVRNIKKALKDPKVKQNYLSGKISHHAIIVISPSESEQLLPKPDNQELVHHTSKVKSTLFTQVIPRFVLILLALVGVVFLILPHVNNNSEVHDEEESERSLVHEALANLNGTIEDFALAKVENEIWQCGGISKNLNGSEIVHQNPSRPDQSELCRILDLNDGEWTPFQHKMNRPRIKSVMFTEGKTVIVMSGETSDPKSKTGCRSTKEIFDTDNPTAGWTLQDIEETTICKTARQLKSSMMDILFNL